MPSWYKFCVRHTALYCVHRTVSLYSKIHACVFNCNLPPAFLAEWPEPFTCYCGNTGVEQVAKQESAQKVDPGQENAPTGTFRSLARVRCSNHRTIPAPLTLDGENPPIPSTSLFYFTLKKLDFLSHQSLFVLFHTYTQCLQTLPLWNKTNNEVRKRQIKTNIACSVVTSVGRSWSPINAVVGVWVCTYI